MNLLALADFNLVAKHGGVGRAARATGRAKATLSRRVSELESSLQLRLFERGSHNLKLTQEGIALYERTKTLFTELDETINSVTSGATQPSGRLRISAPLLFCQLAMGKLAAEFAMKYPDVQLEVTTEDRPVDMVEEAYDLVIRVNPDIDENLYGRVFLRDRLLVVASPDLIRPSKKQSISVVVRGNSPTPSTWHIVTPSGKEHLTLTPKLHLSSIIMVRDAVRAGAGAGLLPVSLVSEDLKTGRLVSWGETEGPEITLWALYPSRRLLNARVTAFLDFLKEAFPTGEPEELAAYVGA
ncbi:MAG TPA: LysR family transcriptional regulator [Methylophaga aminisulfidivorans]|uniref:LysR family transcriptional regulator n=1 Tax=Methylophaga TaxID=40222 RepID=UPI001768834B|nr:MULTISPECIES: LysR family transcriptional regulator [Methylophaga]HIC47583.1 LysR family transcriptional regulator [Methylophaga sp.]HIM39870.1 LysR family transcriptional regulator [Methylophaga aminisulfidivorans]